MSEVKCANQIWNDRLVQLAQDIIDPHLEPGPLDREDIRNALCELLELRGEKPIEAAA